MAGHAYVALAGTNPKIAGPLSAVWLLLALMIFGILAYTLNTGIVAVAVGLESKAPIAGVWRKHFSALWLNYFGGAFGAMLLTLLTHVYTLDVIILLTPLPIILYIALQARGGPRAGSDRPPRQGEQRLRRRHRGAGAGGGRQGPGDPRPRPARAGPSRSSWRARWA